MPHPLEGIMSPGSHRAWKITTTIASQRGFYLARGTGLAIYLHHRKSTDLDFFIYGNLRGRCVDSDLVMETHGQKGKQYLWCGKEND